MIVSGCDAPSDYGNAMVLHVVAPSCNEADAPAPLLMVERVESGWGKATLIEWHTMHRFVECGEPFSGHSWNGEVLQVWVSDSEWRATQQVRVQLGHQTRSPDIWAIDDDNQLRLDYNHMFLGTIDIGGDGHSFVPATDVGSIMIQLEDRQNCDSRKQRRESGCELDGSWEHADPFTFQAINTPQHNSDDDPLLWFVPP